MDTDYRELADGLKNKKILYIEDDLRVAKQLMDFLELFNANITQAKNLKTGWELYNSIKPDIIIADINLPDGCGLDIVKKIRDIDSCTRIVMLTAHTDKELLLSAVELGITRYLVKPLNENSFIDALKKGVKELEENRCKGDIIDLGEGLFYSKRDHQVTKEGQKILLSAQETKLLGWLCDIYPGILSYEAMEHLFETPQTPNAIRILVKKIRLKTRKSLIKNIPNIGYLLCI